MADTPILSRRALLRGSAAGFGLVLLAGTGLALRGSRLRPMPAAGLVVFSQQEYSILAAIADRVCPRTGRDVKSPSEIDVAALTDTALANAEDDVKQGVKTALRIVENALGGALFGERITPFTQLSGEEQDRVLLAFRDSRAGVRRTIFRALSSLAASVYYGHPDTFASVGYPGPPSAPGLRVAYASQLVDFDALRARREAP